MEKNNEETIIKGLREIYSQNQKITKLLENLSPQRLLMLQGMSKEDPEKIAKEVGFTN